MIVTVTVDNFEEKVLKSEALVFVDCYADWCAPCKALKPLLIELEESNEGLVLGMLDIDSNPELAVRLKVASIPKVVVFKGGEEIASLCGVCRTEDYQEIIDKF